MDRRIFSPWTHTGVDTRHTDAYTDGVAAKKFPQIVLVRLTKCFSLPPPSSRPQRPASCLHSRSRVLAAEWRDRGSILTIPTPIRPPTPSFRTERNGVRNLSSSLLNWPVPAPPCRLGLRADAFIP